jgi:hypothetical protein
MDTNDEWLGNLNEFEETIRHWDEKRKQK